MPSAGLPQGVTTHAILLTDSMKLLHKVKSRMGNHSLKLLWVYCPGHAWDTGWYIYIYLTSLSLGGNLGRHSRATWVRHSSRKSSATHSNQCVQCFRVTKQWYSCQCLAVTCAQMLLHAIAHRRGLYGHRLHRKLTGRKIPCRTWDSNPSQHCAWPSSRTLC